MAKIRMSMNKMTHLELWHNHAAMAENVSSHRFSAQAVIEISQQMATELKVKSFSLKISYNPV